MRTLLNESLPPNSTAAPSFSLPEQIGQPPRTFSENAVLADNTADLQEVGLGGAVIARPGARANQAKSAPGRGVAPASKNQPDGHSRSEHPEEISAAAELYAKEVSERSFPGPEQVYSLE